MYSDSDDSFEVGEPTICCRFVTVVGTAKEFVRARVRAPVAAVQEPPLPTAISRATHETGLPADTTAKTVVAAVPVRGNLQMHPLAHANAQAPRSPGDAQQVMRCSALGLASC